MKKLFIAILILLTITSCSDTTPEQIEKVKVGMSQQEVITALGEPYNKEYRTGGCVLKYVYYVGINKNHLYIYIKNGKVDNWF